MINDKRVCPVEIAGSLDSRVRTFFQNPRKILKPYILDGMIILDLGCGPGFFSIAMAEMVGKKGKIIAVDLQEGMLQKLKNKIKETKIEERIKLHKCEKERIGVSDKIDFLLAFYMVHEVPDQDKLFREIRSMLKEEGKVLIVEPKFHVSKKAFKETKEVVEKLGFEIIEQPKLFMSRAIVLRYINTDKS
jgi:ubiquinone/menaquinone biosynthesis C-methylase UbiE